MTRFQEAASSDSVRAVLQEVFAAPRYQWELPPDPWRWLREGWETLVTWLTRLQADHPGAYVALLVGSVVLLVAILVHMGYLTWLAFRRREDVAAGTPGTQRVPHDAAWHLAAARTAEAAGRYDESLAHRFAALVLSLDRRALLRMHPAKTPAEYVQEARLEGAGRAAFAASVAWLYDHLFGGRPVTPEGLAEFDRRAREVMAHAA